MGQKVYRHVLIGLGNPDHGHKPKARQSDNEVVLNYSKS